jgi:hypothetical protein
MYPSIMAARVARCSNGTGGRLRPDHSPSLDPDAPAASGSPLFGLPVAPSNWRVAVVVGSGSLELSIPAEEVAADLAPQNAVRTLFLGDDAHGIQLADRFNLGSWARVDSDGRPHPLGRIPRTSLLQLSSEWVQRECLGRSHDELELDPLAAIDPASPALRPFVFLPLEWLQGTGEVRLLLSWDERLVVSARNIEARLRADVFPFVRGCSLQVLEGRHARLDAHQDILVPRSAGAAEGTRVEILMGITDDGRTVGASLATWPSPELVHPVTAIDDDPHGCARIACNGRHDVRYWIVVTWTPLAEGSAPRLAHARVSAQEPAGCEVAPPLLGTPWPIRRCGESDPIGTVPALPFELVRSDLVELSRRRTHAPVALVRGRHRLPSADGATRWDVDRIEALIDVNEPDMPNDDLRKGLELEYTRLLQEQLPVGVLAHVRLRSIEVASPRRA